MATPKPPRPTYHAQGLLSPGERLWFDKLDEHLNKFPPRLRMVVGHGGDLTFYDIKPDSTKPLAGLVSPGTDHIDIDCRRGESEA